jgi:hypothetical protein
VLKAGATSKEELAYEMGADSFVASSQAESMTAARGTLDLILNTIPVAHDYLAFQPLLAKGGKQVLLGLHAGLPAGLVVNALTGGKSSVLGSAIGGIASTQEVIDLCDRKQIYPQAQVIGVEQLNSVYEKLANNNDKGVRYVLDLEGTLNEDAFAKCVAPPPQLGTCFAASPLCAVWSRAAARKTTGPGRCSRSFAAGPAPPPISPGAICGECCKLLCCRCMCFNACC